jgi:CRP/FNR family cyclic AMP-dependent transcriptional regulator
VISRSDLANVEFFRDFTAEEQDLISGSAASVKLVRGNTLFQEGEEATHMYVCQSGRLSIGNRSFDGRESMFALMEAGSLFGEMSLFDGQGRSAQARALEPSTVIAISYDSVRRVLEDRPALLWSVVELLSNRVRAMDKALADAFFLDVTGRTAKRLLELAGDHDVFSIPITQEELAGLVGASRERVNKAISAFLRLGWIEQNDRDYRILKRRELEIRAN